METILGHEQAAIYIVAPASDLFVQIAQEDTSPQQTVIRGSHQSFHPHIDRQRHLRWCLHGGLGTFGSLSLTWSQSCSPSLGLGLSLGPGLWPAEPETLGNSGTNTVPKLGVNGVSKLTELAAASLLDLGLDLLGLYEASVASARVLTASVVLA